MSNIKPETAISKQVDAERSAVVWSVLNGLGTKGTSLVVYLVLARLLGPEVFGVMALGLAATTLLEALCEHKLGSILIQRSQISEIELNSVFVFQLGAGLVCAALLAVGANPLGVLLSEPRLSLVLPWLALAMLFNVGSFVQDAVLRRELRFRALTLRNLAANVLGGGVGLGLAALGGGLGSMIAMALTSAVSGAVVLWLATPWRPSIRFSSVAFMPLYRDAQHLAWPNILGSLVQQANMFIVGHFFGTAIAGLYAFSLRIYDVLMRITTFSFSEAAFPILAKKVADPTLYRATFLDFLGSAGCLTVGLMMVAAGLAPVVVPLLFGPHWAPASDYLSIYLFGGAMISMGAYNDVTLMAFAQTRKLAITFYASVAIWLLQLPLLPLLGPLFPAMAWFTKEMVIFPPKALWSLRLMQLPPRAYLRLLCGVLLAGLVGLGVVTLGQRLMPQHGYGGLLAFAVAGGSCFCIAAAVLGVPGMRSAFARLRSVRLG